METTSPRVTPILVNHPQKSEEWYQARLGNLTGSEAEKAFLNISDTAKAALIRDLLNVKTLTPKIKATESFLELWSQDALELFDSVGAKPPEPEARVKYRQAIVAERLTGLSTDTDKFVTGDMKWGIVNEKLAIAKYQLETENIVKEAPFMLHPDLRAGASPDGFVIEKDTGLLGVIECKCLKSTNHLYKIIKTQQIPEEYMVQIHMEIWISGRDFCDFIGYDSRLPKGLEIFVKRVMRDDEYIDNVLEPEVRRFLDDVKRDETYFRIKIREEIERRKKEGLILLPKEAEELMLV